MPDRIYDKIGKNIGAHQYLCNIAQRLFSAWIFVFIDCTLILVFLVIYTDYMHCMNRNSLNIK